MRLPSIPTFPLLVAMLATLAGPALAAGDRAAAEAAYQQERALCLKGGTAQSRADCLREASAARAEASRGRLSSESAQALAANAKRRCTVHVDADARAACERLAAGEGSSTGSVAGGGVLKSLTVTVPAPASAPKP